MADKWSDRLLRTRAQVQTLMGSAGLNYPGFFQISNAVGATKQILVWSKSASTISSFAVNITDDTIGIYDITADTFTIETSNNNLGNYWGTWTPVFTAQGDPINNTATASAAWNYIRVVDIVFCGGNVDVDVITGGDEFHFDLPFLRATNFANRNQLTGVAKKESDGADLIDVCVESESAAKVGNLRFGSAAGATNKIYVTFSYPLT